MNAIKRVILPMGQDHPVSSRRDPSGRPCRAPRFLLHPGDLLCVDNYRVFHGREPYTGYDRILHKLWAWSDMAFGLPSVSDLAPGCRADITEPSR
jgi:hypothetical protein